MSCEEQLAQALRVIAYLEKSFQLISAVDATDYKGGWAYALGVVKGQASLALAAIPQEWRTKKGAE